MTPEQADTLNARLSAIVYCLHEAAISLKKTNDQLSHLAHLEEVVYHLRSIRDDGISTYPRKD